MQHKQNKIKEETKTVSRESKETNDLIEIVEKAKIQKKVLKKMIEEVNIQKTKPSK